MWAKENIQDLEQTQKTFLKLILAENYQENYQSSLQTLQLETFKVKLEERQKHISLNFSKTSIADEQFSDLFPIRNKTQQMKKKKIKLKVFHAHTKRYKNSPMVSMQRMLNDGT